ncbi:activator-dependent family glycosyltransferase [Herbidospora yilanensis]|uniref:activator-dependent family glycosyltransferase n=1 Tax=Herbidospora yilanensis TaxID=354426 RepID=UPI0007833ADA|nr:activator-dependent family glycosyltransferase [Herbidospora yilanensis]
MRVLFAITPGTSTFLPLVPLAWALRTAGHEVRVASQPGFAGAITRAGLTAVPVGRDLDMVRLLRGYGVTDEQLEKARAGLSPPFDVADDPAHATWDGMLGGYADAVDGYRAENLPMIAGLVEFARRWLPDLVIWEPFSYAGAIAARAVGAAHARQLWCLDVFGIAREHFLRLKARRPPQERADPLAEWLGGYARKYGFPYGEELATGHFTIHQLPASLSDQAEGLRYVRMRYVPHVGAATVPGWLRTPPARPRVALTLGFAADGFSGGFAIGVEEVLDHLADLDVEVVATIPDEQRARLRRVPANARLVPFVPLDALVPTCAAVIDHGGDGTVLTTALYGVPQLAVGHHFNEPIMARKLAAQGGALALRPAEATGPAIRAGVLRLLNDPGLRAGAERLRAEMRRLPTPNDLVPELEALTERHRAR